MSETEAIRGELQQEIMRALWQSESASVEEVRKALPATRKGAYTTVQTVLNRLVGRGLVSRRRDGRAFRYAARIAEADYVSQSLHDTLASASKEARRGALANLAEQLPPAELEALREISSQVSTERGR